VTTEQGAGGFHVVTVRTVDDEIVAAFGRLIHQLSESIAAPTRETLEEILGSPSNTVLVARDLREGGRLIGTLTLVVFRVPTGLRAWIEDVVVDEAVRGRGVGEGLTREAIRLALQQGARTVELTSRASRAAANRLYQRLGFIRRETNVYRYRS
jgi:ribosomal protein S18 acetylase RimI-like enzyme